jgi:hypothetical protein
MGVIKMGGGNIIASGFGCEIESIFAFVYERYQRFNSEEVYETTPQFKKFTRGKILFDETQG